MSAQDFVTSNLTTLTGRRIVLGVTGGVAAYKAAELARELVRRGATVRAVLTEAASAFITPLTFLAITGQPARTALHDPTQEFAMGHIELARWADLVIIAPASADCIAKLRCGLAGDLLSALCLVTTAPLHLAPAMNLHMWQHPATCENVAVLAARGVRILGPGEGALACGETGIGRMWEPAAIVEHLTGTTRGGALENLQVLVSAGPTREAIDPVRYISNRSSGKMGYALAEAAQQLGGNVVVVSGPTQLPLAAGIERIDVESAAEMHHAVLSRAPRCDIFISVAAVADYTPASPATHKLKKTAAALTLRLSSTRDILGDVAALPTPPFTVGFAAETEQLETYARAKLTAKRIDMIAANRVDRAEQGFDSDQNALEVFWPTGSCALPLQPKPQLARNLLTLIRERFYAKKHPAENS